MGFVDFIFAMACLIVVGFIVLMLIYFIFSYLEKKEDNKNGK